MIDKLIAADADIGVRSLWRMIRENPEWLINEYLIYCNLIDVKLWKELAWSVPTDERSWAIRTLVLNRTSRGGLIFDQSTRCRPGPMGGVDEHNVVLLKSRMAPKRVVEKIKQASSYQIEMLGNWREALAASSQQDSWIFADPPYIKAGRHLYSQSFVKNDHEELAKALKSEERPWLLFYDKHEIVYEWYQGNNISRLQMPHSSAEARGERPIKQELLISNRF